MMVKTAHLDKMLRAIIALALMWTVEAGHTGDYCDTEVFRGECAEGEVVMMTSAKYGRMKIGRCVEMDLGHVGCHKDVLAIADRRCSGRRVCEIRVPDKEMESSRPCLKELKTYLEASYKCIRVETVTTEHCEQHDEMNVTSPHGFIASSMTTDTPSCDGASHPWVIVSQPGQQINLTLHDFAVEDQTRTRYKSEEVATQVCHEYGIVEDEINHQTTVICGGTHRLNHIYLSQGHVVKLWVTNSPVSKAIRNYIIEYKIVGCPDPTVPEDTWFKRTSEGALMGCLFSQKSWVLECKGQEWKGPINNCTMPRAEERDNIISEDMPFSYGIAIAIIVGAAFGIALVIFIVGLIRYYSRRRRRDRHNHNHNHTCSRETILLRQKAEEGEKHTPVHIPRLVEEHKLPPPETVTFCRHQRHPVRINGNEYEHIWESPLPYPSGSATLTADVHCTLHHHHHPPTKRMEPLYTTFKVDNVNRNKPEKPACYVTHGDVTTLPSSPRAIQQNHHPDCINIGPDSRYSTLERGSRLTNGSGCNGTT